MAKAGGSATNYGILYQALGTVGHALELTLSAHTDQDEIESAILVIEPVGGGGDIQIKTGPRRRVEQWKASTKKQSWSLTQLIDGVLPDLYRATDPIADSYHFMTEGNAGTMTPALQFFKSLPAISSDDDPTQTLDDTQERQFAQGYRATDRQLFLGVVKACKGKDEDEKEARRKTWLMLSRFKLEQPLAFDELTHRIDSWIREVVGFREDVEAKRQELCGKVVELAAKGDQRIRAEDLIREAGLSAKSFRAWHRIRDTLTERTTGRIRRATSYHPDLDARKRPPFHESRPILIVTGDSGQGKTWIQAAVATRSMASEALTVWVSSSEQTSWRSVAAREIWCRGAGQDNEIDLENVADRRKEVNPDAPAPWVMVCIDDVRSKDTLAQIIEFPWEEHGMLATVSVSTSLWTRGAWKYDNRVRSVEAEDFTPQEVRECLRKQGVDWANTAHDVRELIRRPMLSHVYCELAADAPWTPRHEYDLMQAYWNRIHEPSGQQADLAVLRALVGSLLPNPSRYPWSPETCNQAGADQAAIDRLVQSGWLRKLEDGYVEASHDRLLCWALAEYIVQQVRDSQQTTDWLCQTIQSIHTQSDANSRRLGYVPMDVLYLCSQPTETEHVRHDAWQVILALETRAGLGYEDEGLYKNLLPTLEDQIVPCVVKRLEHLGDAGESRQYLPRIAAKALARIGEQHPETVRAVILQCLNSDQEHLQEMGMHLAARFPSPAYLDHCWKLHQTCLHTRQDAKTKAASHVQYRRGFATLSACTKLNAEWIGDRIRENLTAPEFLSELVFLLGEVQSPAGKQVWDSVRSDLVDHVPPEKRRAIAKCILSFRDHDYNRYLREWTGCTEELIAPTCLGQLSYFSPTDATSLVSEVPPRLISLYTSSLRDQLMSHCPQETASKVKQIIEAGSDDYHIYLEIIRCGDRIDAATADLFIDWLDTCLIECEAAGEEEPAKHLFRPLGLLENLHGRTVLDALKARRGTSFETRLADFTCTRADNTTGYVDHEFGAAFEILVRIGGEGVTRAVNALLQSISDWAKIDGCKYATIRPDDETRRLLDMLAQSDKMYDSTSKKPFPLVQQKAANALAALGEDAALIRGVIKIGTQISPDVKEYREHHPEMGNDAISEALAILENPDHESFANAVLALGFSDRPEIRDRIEAILLESEMESDTSMSAMLALEDLGGISANIAERVVQQYRSGHHKFSALKLMATGDPEACNRLMASALPDEPPFDETDQRIIAGLGHDDKTRPLVASQLRGLLKSKGYRGYAFMFEVPRLLDPTDDHEVEKLWETATRPSGGFTVSGARAASIEKLAAIDPEAAYEMASYSLKHEDWDQDRLPGVMLRIDREKAAPEIVNHMLNAIGPGICRAMALQLRSDADPVTVSEIIDDAFKHSDYRRRRAAVFASGFLRGIVSEDSLAQLSLNDTDSDVCRSAVESLRCQQREHEAKCLIGLLNQSTTTDSWSICEDVIHLADPNILTMKDDPLGFLAAIRSKSFSLRKVISDEIEKRSKKVNDTLNRPNKRWEDAD